MFRVTIRQCRNANRHVVAITNATDLRFRQFGGRFTVLRRFVVDININSLVGDRDQTFYRRNSIIFTVCISGDRHFVLTGDNRSALHFYPIINFGLEFFIIFHTIQCVPNDVNHAFCGCDLVAVRILISIVYRKEFAFGGNKFCFGIGVAHRISLCRFHCLLVVFPNIFFYIHIGVIFGFLTVVITDNDLGLLNTSNEQAVYVFVMDRHINVRSDLLARCVIVRFTCLKVKVEVVDTVGDSVFVYVKGKREERVADYIVFGTILFPNDLDRINFHYGTGNGSFFQNSIVLRNDVGLRQRERRLIVSGDQKNFVDTVVMRNNVSHRDRVAYRRIDETSNNTIGECLALE